MTVTVIGQPNYRRFAETFARILAERQGAEAVNVRFTLREDLSTASRSPSPGGEAGGAPSSVGEGDTFPQGKAEGVNV